uniref:Uncharacterized protein n=1 Tax=Anguilla anguilla TaxID=7936 RepID=A0A0E9XYG9_ANGAN
MTRQHHGEVETGALWGFFQSVTLTSAWRVSRVLNMKAKITISDSHVSLFFTYWLLILKSSKM